MNRPDKRRLNYITEEDFYFLTYEILIALHSLSASTGAAFKDHRKLAYLIHLISDERVIGILERNQGRPIISSVDKELLFSSFTKGEMHKREVYKLLLALHKKGFVEIVRGAQAEVFDVILKRQALPKGFLAGDVFFSDRKSAGRLKLVIQRISSLTLETFLTRIYKDYGLNVWAP
jgi:hypothetical protein